MKRALQAVGFLVELAVAAILAIPAIVVIGPATLLALHQHRSNQADCEGRERPSAD